MTTRRIDHKIAGLSSKDIILQIDNNHYALFIDRKSRIVMKDAPRILSKIETLCEVFPETKISIKSTAPICSKTRAFLESQHIEII